jgi:peptide/nickel transport system permease protein
MLYGLIVVGFWLLISLLAPIIAPYSPTHPFPDAVLAPPGSRFLLGTDRDGLDILSRLMWAPRIDLGIAVASTVLALCIGVPVGGFAGYFGGKGGLQGGLATVAMRIVDVSQAFPVFVFALAIVAVLGPRAGNLIVAMAFVNAPVFIWLTRSQVLAVRERAFVEAARCAGNSEVRIAFRHVLPNALAAPLTQLSVVLGFSVLLTAGLSFVGAGVQLPTPEWGLMVSEGASTMITGQWWIALFPGIALGSAVFGFALLGDGLRVYLDPVLRQQAVRAQIGGGGVLHSGVAGPSAVPALVESLPGALPIEPGVGSVPAVNPEIELEPARPGHSAGFTESVAEEPAAARAPILAIRNLRVDFYGESEVEHALGGVSLNIDSSESVGVVGTTGSGKSVLARAIMGLIQPPGHVAGGSIRYAGRELVGLDDAQLQPLRAHDFGFIVANPRARLNPVLSVGAQLVNVIRAKQPSLGRRAALRHALDLLDMVSIADPARIANSLPHELSGGMCQRILIAMAISSEPKLLIADEPTAGLDVTVQMQVLDLIKGLVDRSGAALILMTRDLGIVAHYTQRVVVLRKGKIVEESEVRRFFERPEDDHSAHLLEAAFASVGSRG